jgi:hypothetical protein
MVDHEKAGYQGRRQISFLTWVAKLTKLDLEGLLFKKTSRTLANEGARMIFIHSCGKKKKQWIN